MRRSPFRGPKFQPRGFTSGGVAPSEVHVGSPIVGTVGDASLSTSAKAAAGTAVGAFGLVSVEVGKKAALGVVPVGAVGMSAADAAAQGAIGFGTARVGLSAAAVAVRNAFASSVGPLGLSASSIALRAAMETTAGTLGFAGSATGGQMIMAFGAGAGAEGLAGAGLGVAGAARSSGGARRRRRAEPQLALVGSSQGTLGLSGRTRGVAFVQEAANDSPAPAVALQDAAPPATILGAAAVEAAEVDSPRLGSAAGAALDFVGSVRGTGTVLRVVVEPVAPSLFGRSAGSSSSSTGGAVGSAVRGGLCAGALRIAGAAVGIGSVPAGSPIEEDEAELIFIFDWLLDEAA